MARPSCTSCSKEMARGARGTTCRACIKPKVHADKFCGDCGVKVCARQNKSGYCRKCLLARRMADPTVNSRRLEAQRKALASPEVKAKIRNIVKKRSADPAYREKMREAGKRNYHLTIGSEKAIAARSTPEVIARRAKTHSERDLAWCPAEYRDQYRHLNTRCGIKADDARRMIFDQIAADRRAKQSKDDGLSPFERQMQALANGATLAPKVQVATRSYDYTLAGGSPL